MTYQELGHYLVPIYTAACFLGLLLAANRPRLLFLTAVYWLFQIGLFELRFDGLAPVYRWKWYLLVAFVQLFIIIPATYVFYCKASEPVRRLGWGLIALNLLYLPFYVGGHPLPRPGYFIGVNSFQALQIMSLIGSSPFWAWVWAKSKDAAARIRSSPWLRRTVISGHP